MKENVDHHYFINLKFPEWDPFRHWLAVTSILLIAGAAGVAVPLALRVAAGKFIHSVNNKFYSVMEFVYQVLHSMNACK